MFIFADATRSTGLPINVVLRIQHGMPSSRADDIGRRYHGPRIGPEVTAPTPSAVSRLAAQPRNRDHFFDPDGRYRKRGNPEHSELPDPT